MLRRYTRLIPCSLRNVCCVLKSSEGKRNTIDIIDHAYHTCRVMCTKSPQMATSWRLLSTGRGNSREEILKSSSFDDMSESDYHKIADKTLEDILDSLGELENTLDDIDIGLSQGVLKINIGNNQVWVLNKQTPNRQIWWSSPLSGPRRYEYDATLNDWKNTRDQSYLTKDLRQEILTCTSIDIGA